MRALSITLRPLPAYRLCTAAAEGKFKVAANGVKYFTDATGRARAENGRFLSSSERAAAGLQAQGRAAQQASGQMSGLISGLGKLAAALLRFAVRPYFD